MNKNWIIILIISILCMVATYAEMQMTVFYQPTIYKGQINNLTAFVKNNNSFDIYLIDFLLPNNFTIKSGVNLSANQSIALPGNYSIATEGSYVQTIIARYYTFTNVTVDPQIWNININSEGITPNNITVNKADIIRFCNNLGYAINITQTNWMVSIENGSCNERQFNEPPGMYEYVANEIFIGKINLNSNIQSIKTHDSTTDVSQNLTLTVKVFEGNISIQSLTNPFSIAWNSYAKGTIVLNSITDIYYATLKGYIGENESQWVTFSENNFNFTGARLVEYEIRPYIRNTSQTNQTYTIRLQVTATNSQASSTNVSVTIPYADVNIIDLGNGSIITLATEEQIKAYLPIWCKDHDEECGKYAKIQYVYRNRTPGDFEDLLLTLNEKVDRVVNKQTLIGEDIIKIKEDANVTSTKLGNITEFNDYLLSEKEKSDENARKGRQLRLYAIGIFIVILIAGVLLYFTRKYKTKEGILRA